MVNFKMKCVNQKLSCQHSPSDYFSGNINIDKIHFEFCNLWDGYVKTAVFTKGDESYMVLLDEKNICRIPKEVLSTTGLLNIGVFGIKDEKRRTSNEVGFYVGQGVQTDGSETDITPDVYQQIVNLCEDAVEKANEAVETANSVREDVDNGTGGNVDLSGYVKKEEFKKLNGAYVFIGTYYEFGKLPYYTSDIKEGITPVFNYQGEQITFEQPYQGAYHITLKDMGLMNCDDGVARAYFSVPQNEGILFKPGSHMRLNMDDGDVIFANTYAVTCTPNYYNPMEYIANIILDREENFYAGVESVDCFPTATFRTGDNVAIIKVAGNVFYEVLSHDYGEEMNVLQEEYKVMNAQVQTKADKQMAVPSTVKTGNPLVLSDQLAGERLLSFQIHGAEGGVGDLTDSGKYQIPIKLYGKNLVNSSIFAADFDLQEDGSYRANKNISTDRKYSVFLPAGTYTISYIMKAPATSNCRISFVLADGTDRNGYIKVSNGEYQHFTKTFTFASPVVSLYWGYGATTSDVSFYDLQIEAGSIRTDYEPYHAYDTKMVLVDAPLGAGETVAVDGMVARDGVSTYVAETSVSPILSIGYYQDINKVIAGLQAMILEA